jgi:hypothetical protein
LKSQSVILVSRMTQTKVSVEYPQE